MPGAVSTDDVVTSDVLALARRALKSVESNIQSWKDVEAKASPSEFDRGRQQAYCVAIGRVLNVPWNTIQKQLQDGSL